jgi:hypothetical protein
MKKCRQSKTAYLNDGLMKFRYLTKFHLQRCAVLSQLGLHESAIENGLLAVKFCQDSLLFTEKLCQRKQKKQDWKTRSASRDPGERKKIFNSKFGTRKQTMGEEQYVYSTEGRKGVGANFGSTLL